MPFPNNNPLNAADFGIPTATQKTFTYVSAGVANDDLISTITYKNDSGTALGVITFTYVGATNNIATMSRTT